MIASLVAQGIDADTAAILDAMPQHEFGDAYSATCRPGSWEFQTEWAAAMQEVLAVRGYEPARDPVAGWRLRWSRGPS